MTSNPIKKQLEIKYVDNPTENSQLIMLTNLSLLVINQYLGLFRPKHFPVKLGLTFDDLLNDQDCYEIQKTLVKMAEQLARLNDTSLIFNRISHFIQSLDLAVCEIQQLLADSLDQVDMIASDEELIVTLQQWYETYIIMTAENLVAQVNYLPQSIADYVTMRFGFREQTTIYAENLGQGSIQASIGGQKSTYINFGAQDEVLSFFNDSYQFVTRISFMQALPVVEVKNCKLALINLANDTPELLQDVLSPTHNQQHQFSIQKLQQLMTTDGQAVVIANKNQFNKIDWHGSSLAYALEQGFVTETMNLLVEDNLLGDDQLTLLFFDMSKAPILE